MSYIQDLGALGAIGVSAAGTAAAQAVAKEKESTRGKIRSFFGAVFGTQPYGAPTSTTPPPATPAYTPPSATPSATPSWLIPAGLGVGALALALIITRRKQ